MIISDVLLLNNLDMISLQNFSNANGDEGGRWDEVDQAGWKAAVTSFVATIDPLYSQFNPLTLSLSLRLILQTYTTYLGSEPRERRVLKHTTNPQLSFEHIFQVESHSSNLAQLEMSMVSTSTLAPAPVTHSTSVTTPATIAPSGTLEPAPMTLPVLPLPERVNGMRRGERVEEVVEAEQRPAGQNETQLPIPSQLTTSPTIASKTTLASILATPAQHAVNPIIASRTDPTSNLNSSFTEPSSRVTHSPSEFPDSIPMFGPSSSTWNLPYSDLESYAPQGESMETDVSNFFNNDLALGLGLPGLTAGQFQVTGPDLDEPMNMSNIPSGMRTPAASMFLMPDVYLLTQEPNMYPCLTTPLLENEDEVYRTECDGEDHRKKEESEGEDEEDKSQYGAWEGEEEEERTNTGHGRKRNG